MSQDIQPYSQPIDSQLSHAITSDDVTAYWTWNGMLHSYRTLKKQGDISRNTSRLSYLRKQIIWNYLKNFFLFPIWFLKFLVPAPFKGKVNIWSNLKTIIKSREFRPLRLAMILQVFFLYAIAQLGIIVFYNYSLPVYTATYTWTQSSWSGGVSTTAPLHPGNQTGWNKYSSASSTVSASSSIALLPTSVSTTHTTLTDFLQGTFSQATTTGSGVSGSVVLASTVTAVNAWDTPLPPVPSSVGAGAQMIRNGSEDFVYVLPGNGSTSFYRYSISGNSWTILTSAPAAIAAGAQMIRNGADDEIYVIRGGGIAGFYRYSISGNSWTSLNSGSITANTNSQMIRNGADDEIYLLQGINFFVYSISGNSWTNLATLPASTGNGASMIRNGADDEIYVLRGNSFGNLYRYSISGNSWTTLTSVGAALSSGSAIIRNGADDFIYALCGGSCSGFYRYSISGNSWAIMTSLPSQSGLGAQIMRNASDNSIYVLSGNSSTGFYRYSISGNSWATLASIPSAVATGARMIRNGSDNDIYVLSGNSSTGFHRHSISGNSWIGSTQSNLATQPDYFGAGFQIIRNGADNEIYVLSGNNWTQFWRYSISGNSWTTLASAPGAIGAGSQMIRNGSENFIYVLQGNGATGFYRYSISGNSWTTLTAYPGGTVTVGSFMLRNGSEDSIYVARGGGTTQFYKYTISNGSWTALTSAPLGINTVSTGIRADGDDYIYVFRGAATATFYRYSISGDSWTTLTSAPATIGAGAQMIRNGSDDDIYVLQGNSATGFYRYSISGNSWTTLTALPATAGGSASMIRNGSDNEIYVLGPSFYRYSISGNSWTTLPASPNAMAGYFRMIRNGSDGEMYVILDNHPTVFAFYRFILNSVTYNSPGTYTSSVIDTSGTAGYTTVSFVSSTPSGTTLTIDARAGNTPTPDETWTAWQTGIASGGSITSLGARRYIQYRANLATSNTARTPSFDSIILNYDRYTSGSLISSPYNAADSANVLGSIAWSATTPAGTTIKFQLRSSPNNSSWTAWTGPDGTSNTYFTDASGAQDTPALFKDSSNDQWMQYRATLEGNGTQTPVLTGTTLSYVVNAPPDIAIVTSTPVSQSSSGLVSVDYQVRDIDTLSGATPGFVSVDLQYCTSNCSSSGNEVWATAATSSVSGDVGPSIAIEAGTYTEYSIVWDPKISFDNQYNGTNFKIRLRANDSEAANNIGVGESNIFTLDTTDPEVSVGIDGRSDAPYSLLIDVSDDTMSNLEMKLSNNSALLPDEINPQSGMWIPYTATSTWDLGPDGEVVYYQVRDRYGNISLDGSISQATTPAIPDNIVYRDVSNAQTSEWREFIAWGIIDNPTPGFLQYTLYRSVDGVVFSPIKVEPDRLVNYYLDDNLDTGTTYYYKVVAEDEAGNISNYSNVVSDRPDGQSGSDLTPPSISNVTTTFIGTETATIEWHTDELADSLVDYTTDAGDFDNAETVGLTYLADNPTGLGVHSVVLTDLIPNTTYYFRVRSFDPSNNEGIGTNAPNGFTFTTQLGPSISDVAVTDVTNHSATIVWNTDQLSDSYVHYSLTSNFASSTTVGSADAVGGHEVTLVNLQRNTTYYYYVSSGIAEDKNVVEGEVQYYMFHTTTDLQAPIITFDLEANVSVSDETIALYWLTDEAASSTVEYGTSEEYGSMLINNNFNVDHNFTLSNLLPGTEYFIRIISADIDMNVSSAIEFSISTVDTADYAAPVISNVQTSVVTDDEALILWNTNEAATGQVLYGTASSSYTLQSDLVSSYNIDHAITLGSLSSSTLYYYVVVSADSSGNTTTSTQYSFTTLEKLSEESEVKLREEEAAAVARAEGYAAGVANGGIPVRSSGTSRRDEADTQAPTVVNARVENISGKSATVLWSADEDAVGIIEFGTDTTYSRSAIETPIIFKKTQSISLSDLQPLTTYYYRVSALDKAFNQSNTITGTFTTTLDDIDPFKNGEIDPGVANVEEIYLSSMQKATELIRSISTQVGVGALESSIIEQNKVIKELSTLLPLPIIGGQPIVEVGSSYVTISWTTDKLSNSLVEFAPDATFGITSAYEQTAGDSTAKINNHTVTIQNLLPNTLYHYRVISATEAGAETRSRDFTFRTKIQTSEITNYKIEILSPEEIVVSWVTNVPTNAQVSIVPYRNEIPVLADRKIVRNLNYGVEHSFTVSDLEAGMLYDLELSGTDYGDSTVSRTIRAFSTDGRDLPPIISQIKTETAILPGGKDRIQVIISWVTNELTTSRVYYRKGFAADGTEFTESTPQDTNYVRKHVVVTSNFEPGQVYQFVVESLDSAANTSTSKVITILTPQKEQSVFQVIMSNVEDMFSWVGKIRR